MRMLMKVLVPVEAGNAGVRDGRIQKVIKGTMESLRPEAAYFLTDTGQRAALFVFDLRDVSQIPAIAEPYFLQLNAQVSFSPVMNAEDLGKGIQAASQNF